MNNQLTTRAQDILNLLSIYEDQLNYSDYQTINDILTDLQMIVESYDYNNIDEDDLYTRAMNSRGCGCGGGGGGTTTGGRGAGRGGGRGGRY